DDAAIKPLRIARHFALETVEIDDDGGRGLGRAVRSKRGRRVEPHRASRTARGAAIEAATEGIGELAPRAVGAHLQNLAAEAVIAPGGSQSVRAGVAGRQSEAWILLPALALPERIGGRSREAALRIVGRAR